MCIFFPTLYQLESSCINFGVRTGGYGEGFLLSTTGSIGVVLVAIVSGYGAVKSPYANISRLMNPVTERQLREQQKRLLHTLQLIGERKRTVLQGTHQANSRDSKNDGYLSNVLGWILRGGSGGKTSEREMLYEIEALESMSVEMHTNLENLIDERERMLYSATCIGRLKNVWGSIAVFTKEEEEKVDNVGGMYV
ncbi:hypothetical protein Pmar_PMAR016248 [Perkinsus marinus ATCC 50983]|uniref:Golgi pH regulator conserved domain-containing protein n=1 Tax=Perkinsus marinus (strain ATCC 50983 / TXsc) TaxID=423536 RepID=C5KIY7_PERM5|nr:hypothetical protein Pmar_PMAR016248 [Perkinsus marinus ATCC 50983]EER15563.1 hypothetical protein Pmar_PMAR016248 [Perkinsus marinus ATCC 50983]|eukprot:XP_002783767.1 hypothetical protein Pmar_PMAR016248 [Perkinsus marinus ATCC 50983]